MMKKKFVFKLFVFSLPVLAFFSFPVLVLFLSGENFDFRLEELIRKKQPYLIGFAYHENNYKYLKLKELENRDSLDIIAIGSSRVLQFRDTMFTRPFYNAGYTVSGIGDFIPFMEKSLKGKNPEVILISLDQWMFNSNWDKLSGYKKEALKWNADYQISPSVSTIFNVWSDLISSKYGAAVFLNNADNRNLKKIGLNAILNNKGFLNDGSMYYGDQIKKLLSNDRSANDYGYADTYSRIEKGRSRFEYGNQVNDKALEALRDLLFYARSRGIYVVAFLPPFAPKVNLKMKQSGKFVYMDSIPEKGGRILKDFGFELWDLSDPLRYGSDDHETLDGFHGGEVCHLRMLIYMIENGSRLKQYSNVNLLKKDLNHRVNNYLVYPGPGD